MTAVNCEFYLPWYNRTSGMLRGMLRGCLEDVAPQILVFEDLRKALAHLGGVEDEVLDRVVGQLEQQLFEQRGHHGVQPAGADIFHLLVRLRRDARDLADAVGGELEG